MRCCRVCSSKNKVKWTQYFCRKCYFSLPLCHVFELQHTKTRFWTYLHKLMCHMELIVVFLVIVNIIFGTPLSLCSSAYIFLQSSLYEWCKHSDHAHSEMNITCVFYMSMWQLRRSMYKNGMQICCKTHIRKYNVSYKNYWTTEYIVLIWKILLHSELSTNFIIYTLHKTTIISIHGLHDLCSLAWLLVHVSTPNCEEDTEFFLISMQSEIRELKQFWQFHNYVLPFNSGLKSLITK
jgi:hypothetical protein